MPIYEIQANGKTYEVDAPSMEMAATAIGPQMQAGPPPGVIAQNEDTRPVTGTMMDLIPPPSQRRKDLAAYESSLPLAVPGVIGDVRKLPGIISQAAKLPATKQIAKEGGKYVAKRAIDAAGWGAGYAAWRKIFD